MMSFVRVSLISWIILTCDATQRYAQVSFGPTIEGAHSPDEKVNIASVGNFWQLVLATLEGLAVPHGQ